MNERVNERISQNIFNATRTGNGFNKVMSTGNGFNKVMSTGNGFKSASTIGRGRSGTSYLTDFDETWPV